MAGWISLHRKIIDNPIYSNAFMLKLWIHCLMKASHKEHSQLVGNQMVNLEPGQFITGRNSLADEFNKGAKKDEVISAITLWRWLKNFEEWQMLNIKASTKYSVVTVINWAEHQPSEQQVNNKRTTDEQQVNTNNNDKNVNKDNKITTTAHEPKKIADNQNDFTKRLLQRYVELRAYGFHHTPKDELAAVEIQKSGVPLAEALSTLEMVFANYRPKHKSDRINGLSYCIGAILDKHFRSTATSEKTVQPKEDHEYQYGF